jgi:hypothetical protein
MARRKGNKVKLPTGFNADRSYESFYMQNKAEDAKLSFNRSQRRSGAAFKRKGKLESRP